MTYRIDEITKLEVKKVSKEDYSVKFLELMGSRWVQLGQEEHWRDIEDVKIEYGLD